MIQQRPPLSCALVALSLCLCACGGGAKASGPELADTAIRRRERVRVRTAPVEVREMVRRLSTTTTVESENEIQLFPRVSGVVVELHADEGSRVAKGDVLAILDDRSAQAALEDARVALQEAKDAVPRLELAVREAFERAERAKLGWEQAQREVERNEKAALLSAVELDRLRLTRDTNERDYGAAGLAHEGAQQDLEKQQTTIERAELAVERQELELSYTRIVAPFDGIVATRSIRVGDTVSSGGAAFTLTDPDHLRAVVYRPQRELPFFQASRQPDGSEGEIEILVHPEALPGQVYAGHIRTLSPTIDPESGSFRLTIDLEQPVHGDARPRLLPGMLVRLEITTERHPDALVVPKRALRREGDQYTVVVARAGKAVVTGVREGFSDDDDVEIVAVEAEGVGAGDEVVVVGNRDLEDGAELDATPWRDDAPEAEGGTSPPAAEPREQVAAESPTESAPQDAATHDAATQDAAKRESGAASADEDGAASGGTATQGDGDEPGTGA